MAPANPSAPCDEIVSRSTGERGSGLERNFHPAATVSVIASALSRTNMPPSLLMAYVAMATEGYLPPQRPEYQKGARTYPQALIHNFEEFPAWSACRPRFF